MINYELITTTDEAIDESSIKTGLGAAEKKIPELADRTVSIEIVSPEESAKLNNELRGQNEPTDCISISTHETHVGQQDIKVGESGELNFDLKQDAPLQHTLPHVGQLVLCLAVINANATAAGQPLSRELEWVVEHGMLHLVGFHHEHDQ